MYKVMLIDDEATVRNLMKKIISWNDYNMEIVGEAESGIEAINIIDELRPDLCFVDIRMPFMDGIEFSKLALKQQLLASLYNFSSFIQPYSSVFTA